MLFRSCKPFCRFLNSFWLGLCIFSCKSTIIVEEHHFPERSDNKKSLSFSLCLRVWLHVLRQIRYPNIHWTHPLSTNFIHLCLSTALYNPRISKPSTKRKYTVFPWRKTTRWDQESCSHFDLQNYIGWVLSTIQQRKKSPKIKKINYERQRLISVIYKLPFKSVQTQQQANLIFFILYHSF